LDFRNFYLFLATRENLSRFEKSLRELSDEVSLEDVAKNACVEEVNLSETAAGLAPLLLSTHISLTGFLVLFLLAAGLLPSLRHIGAGPELNHQFN
jgi:anti-sigma factor RsiW